MSPLRGLTYKTHDYPTLRSVVGFASSLTSGGVSNSRASSRLWIKIKPMALLSQSSTFNRRQKSVDFVFLCHDSAIFKQAWLRLPPSHLGNIQASLILLSVWRRLILLSVWRRLILLSVWRRFLTVASLRDLALGHALGHGLFYCHIGCPIILASLTLKFYQTVIIKRRTFSPFTPKITEKNDKR